MKVFLSWSGDRSKMLAETLKEWLPTILQVVEPWMSLDIQKGAIWSKEIAAELDSSSVGIICLTPENLESPWLHFEAGALAKHESGRAFTLLLGLEHKDVKHPLAIFQHTLPTKDDFQKLIANTVEVGRAADK